MGEEVAQQEFSRADRTRHREKVRRNLDVFARMLREAAFDTDDPMTGLEMELNLIDDAGDPALKNAEVLEAIADPDFQTELGQFNIEINLAPAKLREGGLATFEESLRHSLNEAEEKGSRVGAHQVMIGILPTLAEGHMTRDSLSANPRYALLSEQILNARGEDITISISGKERLTTTADSIVPEAACTSTQFHVQTSPDQFAAYWNAAQSIAGVQLAVSANSPYLLGKELWRETRIPLFEQATDTRSEELKAQGVRPRVWFGERWITSVFDLFEENVRYFPALLPVTDEEDPLEVLEAGGTPALHELKLHNGTIYRWNRPVYDISQGRPHLRVENRLLAAGPTVADTIANAALWFGLIRYLVESERPLWSQMSFSAAEENFHVAAQTGVDAQVYWPGIGQVRATELVLRRLLPMAHAGLESWGVPSEQRDRYLGIIEQRCQAEASGAGWFVDRVRERGGEDRYDALRATLLDYRDRMHSNEPVHAWD
jgi:gamma-glutamyl:cysteine ligase YbdK (ATP-grasp superfamily)